MRYTTFNWKFKPNTDTQIIKEKAPVLAPPMINTARSTIQDSDFAKRVHTPFKANPQRQWRKQYSTIVPSNMGTPVKVRNNMYIVETPGATIVSKKTENETIPDCKDTSLCQSSPVEPDYLVAYRNKDEENNKVGTNYPANFAGKVTQREGTTQYKRCVYVCDPEKTARRRSQYPSAVNTQVYTNETELCYNKSKYHQSNSAYLRSRCRTYTQNLSNSRVSAKPGTSLVERCASCPERCAQTNCANSCKPIIYKPNNPKFSQQGAASGSTQILRRKYDAIQRFANQFTGQNFGGLYGDATASAYAYSSRTETPFTIKNKQFTAEQCRTNLDNYRRKGKFSRTIGEPSTIKCNL